MRLILFLDILLCLQLCCIMGCFVLFIFFSEPPEPLERSGDGEEQHFVTRPTSGAVEASLSVSTSDEYKELAHLLCVEYWKRKGTEEETVGSHAASNLARDWYVTIL